MLFFSFPVYPTRRACSYVCVSVRGSRASTNAPERTELNERHGSKKRKMLLRAVISASLSLLSRWSAVVCWENAGRGVTLSKSALESRTPLYELRDARRNRRSLSLLSRWSAVVCWENAGRGVTLSKSALESRTPLYELRDARRNRRSLSLLSCWRAVAREQSR